MGMMAARVSLPATAKGRGPTFEACYRAHHARVYHHCLRYGGGNASFAEDVTHDVFLKLLEHLPALDERHDLGGWLYRVAANLAVTRLRRSRSIVRRFLPAYRRSVAEVEPALDAAFEQREAASGALATLRTLPPRERVVLCMKLLDGKSQREIAATLSLTEGYVSKLYARAWQRVRAAGWEGDDDEA
jgi:RNA polymerase sigma-70 factor (ECF subfamily)